MRDKNNRVRPINWNEAPEYELAVWNRLVSNFWVPEKVPLSTDIPSWNTLSDEEQLLVMRVFAGLTLLDTIQGTVGMSRILPDSKNAFEEAIICNMQFMEQIHSKSYSSIFSTLSNTKDINKAFTWSEENNFLQFKADRIVEIYDGKDEDKRKIASVFLESALFYSGFALPFYLASRGKLSATADIIRLILRDESVHGAAIGYWYQRNIQNQPEDRRLELERFTYELLMDLYDNEEEYTRSLYAPVGLTHIILPFVRYNFNKALLNLGYNAIFPADDTVVDPAILASLSPNADENHDFFSGSGSSYVIGAAENTEDEDWDF